MRKALSVLLLAGLMAAECGDTTEPTSGSVTGTWTLQAVGGQSLPATVTEDGDTFSVTGGGAVVNANGTFSWSETYGGGYSDGSDAVSGTWAAGTSANTYVFTPSENDGSATGVVTGNVMSLTISSGGAVRTYQRQ